MPAPGELYSAGAGLLEAAGSQASNVASNRERASESMMRANESASGELGADRQKMSAQEAAMALEKLRASDRMQGKTIVITPQLALGLAKNTGDKEWLSAIGQDMRSDVLLGMYTHGMSLAQSKKAPKITQVYDGGKIRHAVVYTDEQENQQQLLLDAGMTPEALNKGKGGKGGSGGGAGNDDLKKQKEFMRAHEKQAAILNDAKASSRLKDSDPKQWNRVHDEYIKDQDRYDELKTQMGKSGGATPASGGGSSGVSDNSPFDADAFIKDALGQ